MSDEFSSESSEFINNQDALINAIENGTLTWLDGVMSPISKALALKLKSTQFDMNAWWVESPTSWVCSGCGRGKLEIARLNSNKEIMCHLVEHHDHMKDILKRRFQEMSVSLEKVIASAQAEKFAKRSSMMISSFENTVVCIDCNNADASAKKVARAHPDFSFSPQEIKQFIISTPNQPHEINVEIARAIWKQNERTFALRLKIADHIAKIAANNEDWFQPGEFTSTPEYITRSASKIISDWSAYGVLLRLKGSRKRISNRSVSAWRLAHHPIIKTPPTHNEIEHAGLVGNPKFWEGITDEWQCPGCQRSKRALVRKNKLGEWTLPISSRNLYSEKARWRREDTTACSDCIKVAEDMGKEAAYIAEKHVQGYAAQVSIHEVRQCVIPHPHSRHNINNEIAEKVLEVVVQRISLLSEP